MDSTEKEGSFEPEGTKSTYYENPAFESNENVSQKDDAAGFTEKQRNNLPETFHPSQLGSDNDKPVTIWKLDGSGNVNVENGQAADEDGERDVWDNPVEFLFSCISMSVGLGNVWRFPFIAYNNGGGAFLIPYFIVLIFIGRPIYYLEMCIGQFSSYSQVKIWNMAPMFKGVGYGAIVGTICVVSYYCSIMAQTVFYFFASFNKDLPWSYCHDDWGEEYCTNGSLVDNTTTTAALYYKLDAFVTLPNIEDGLGDPEWRLTLCLLFSWIIVFLSLVKGVKSSGKVAYFTAIFPYVVLLILLIRGVTLPGAGKGLEYLFRPEWEKLYDPKVWYEAVGQCFFSLGTGFGPIIMFSSYNPFRHNVYRDAWVISFMDTFTSLLASCTIFAVLGYLSEETGLPMNKVATAGSGLAFVSYPEAIARFDFVPQLFAVLFFLMLFTLGIGSATSLTGGIISIICDQFPEWKRWLVTLVVSVLGFLVGLMYVTPGGPFMVDLIDHFGANFVIYVMAMLEVGGIAWIYGLKNIRRDIEFMSGRRPGWYWMFCWGGAVPIGLFVILVYQLATEEEYTSGDVPYPKIAIICGWAISAFALALVPGWAIHAVWSRKSSTLKQKFLEALRPTVHWGPQNVKTRQQWEQYKKNYTN